MITAGIGFRAACPAQELALLVRRAEALAGCAAECLAAPAFKSGAPALHEAAGILALPLRLIDPAVLEAAQPRCTTSSATAEAAVGFAAIAEACALAAAGPASQLILLRIASPSATCALAGTAS